MLQWKPENRMTFDYALCHGLAPYREKRTTNKRAHVE